MENKKEFANKKVFPGTVEWRDYEFFLCDRKTKNKHIKTLVQRGWLMSDKTPDHEAIREHAEYFAARLANRINEKGRLRHFGLANIAANIESFGAQFKDCNQCGLYFYMAYLYGLVDWRMPYNVQRLPVAPDALTAYLEAFSETLCACLNDLSQAETEDGENYETEGSEFEESE